VVVLPGVTVARSKLPRGAQRASSVSLSPAERPRRRQKASLKRTQFWGKFRRS